MKPDSLSHFFGNDEKVLSAVKMSCSIRHFTSGEILVHQKDRNNEVFVILKGQVRAFVLSSEGHEIWLDDFGRGEIFGEMAAIGGFERTSNVVAVTKVTTAIFPADKFLDLMTQFGSIGIAVSEVLVKRIRATTRRMFELSVLSAPGRIYAELLRLSKPLNGGMGEKEIISPLPVFSSIAHRVNSTRETVSRAINDLERRGLIIRENDSLVIITPKKMGQLIT